MNKIYYELTVTLDNNFVEFIADFISSVTEDGIELGKGQIIVRSESDLTSVKDALVSLVDGINGSTNSMKMTYQLEEKENKDWIKTYQDSVQPIEAGKFYIFPSWYEPKKTSSISRSTLLLLLVQDIMLQHFRVWKRFPNM